jgi:hypothetical protein
MGGHPELVHHRGQRHTGGGAGATCRDRGAGVERLPIAKPADQHADVLNAAVRNSSSVTTVAVLKNATLARINNVTCCASSSMWRPNTELTSCN